MNVIAAIAMLLIIAGLSLALMWTLRQLHLEIAGQDEEQGVARDD